MEFRPCIDIHNGQVKQIVGGSLRDQGDFAKENFVSQMAAADYARLYRDQGLRGGHIILLNGKDSPYYEADVRQAKGALEAWPGALQIGGGVNGQNAREWIQAGASHVIVTSYVFVDGQIRYDRIEELVETVGKDHLVLDLSCRLRDGAYYVVTDRWQKFTDQALDRDLIHKLASYCDEFLVHAVNVEGSQAGVDLDLIDLLASAADLPMTYAGGVGSMEDMEKIRRQGAGKVNVTVGSALDLFGGQLSFQ
ncbi:MAG: phosphoribosylformimino-5-aminoimidazole carboxamide ribotide isomerase, partial [Eubacterium sp.]|nr:phosphoribosylformimino-5-aminoimidazole carboxamide ribotide isomerase [Eubacterium sp.]